MSLDFSDKPDLAPLAQVTRDLQTVAAPLGTEFFLMGAAARDLLLTYAHGIAPDRLTKDVDFAVMVGGWTEFDIMRTQLIARGAFNPRAGPAAHRLSHAATGLPLDIVPFGGVERADRTIAWPPANAEVFDCFGMQEAFRASQLVQLPNGIQIHVASIPALALLKIFAWRDRKYSAPGRDASDLLLYLRHYMDCGNLDRAAIEHPDLFEVDAYDNQVAGTILLTRDMAKLLDSQAIATVLGILEPEADEAGQLLLAGQSNLDLERARHLLMAMCQELKHTPHT